VFVPFQRLGDTDNTTGVGLGLALSRGLTEAMDGTLEPEETPGGGLTMVLSLPAAPMPDHTGQGDPGRRERDQAPSPQVAPAAPATPSAEPATLSAEPVTSSAEPATPAEPVTPASAPATPPAAAEGGRLAT
jgi:two-component system sensor histidine kinase KdpD